MTLKALQLVLLPLISSNAIAASKPPSLTPIASASSSRDRRRVCSVSPSWFHLHCCCCCYCCCSLCLSPKSLSSSSCSWSRKHCIATAQKSKIQPNQNQIRLKSNQIDRSSMIMMIITITLGPAGPPLQRGVLEVPQSAQVFFCSLPEEAAAAAELGFPSSASDPWNKTKKTRSAKTLYRNRIGEESRRWITHFSTRIHHFRDQNQGNGS